jgi:membrane carboxypeptidase/penicillin-binding protein
VGYTPNLVCAVWIGFDDNQQLGLTGAEAALPAWVEFMKGAVDLRPELGGRSFDQPEGITIADVDPETDELATAKCPMRERVAMLTSDVPRSECFRHNFYFDEAAGPAFQTVAAVSSDSARLRKSQNTRPVESALLRNTQIDTDKLGRRVLVNDLKPAPSLR